MYGRRRHGRGRSSYRRGFKHGHRAARRSMGRAGGRQKIGYRF